MKALLKVGAAVAMATALALPMAGAATAEVERPLPARAMCDDFIADYWERQQCEQAGRAGLGVEWRHYTCEEDWLDWNLYVCY